MVSNFVTEYGFLDDGSAGLRVCLEYNRDGSEGWEDHIKESERKTNLQDVITMEDEGEEQQYHYKENTQPPYGDNKTLYKSPIEAKINKTNVDLKFKNPPGFLFSYMSI